MTAKEYLSRALYLRMNINRLDERIKEMEIYIQSVRAIRYDKPNVQSSREDPMAKNVAKLLDAEDEAIRLRAEYEAEYNEIENQIKMLESEKHKAILAKRYLEGKGMWQIADELGYSVDWVKHLHTRALAAFEDLM
ncbi:MAG: hypothetical protein IJL43_00475 [Lachnospiraceae bacterium]|nr:hypothetical protein [Lachnospiraceae bacterium]